MKALLIESFAAFFLLAPLFLLLNRIRFHNRKRTCLYFLFSLYLAAVYHLTGLPTVQFITFDVNLNLIPKELFTKELVLSLLNIAMFVPLGFFLPLLWKKYCQAKYTLLFALGATVSIELAQLLTYRATDINDIITNLAGACIGYLLWRLFTRALPGSGSADAPGKDLPILFLCVAGIMFFLQPMVTSLIYKLI